MCNSSGQESFPFVHPQEPTSDNLKWLVSYIWCSEGQQTRTKNLTNLCPQDKWADTADALWLFIPFWGSKSTLYAAVFEYQPEQPWEAMLSAKQVKMKLFPWRAGVLQVTISVQKLLQLFNFLTSLKTPSVSCGRWSCFNLEVKVSCREMYMCKGTETHFAQQKRPKNEKDFLWVQPPTTRFSETNNQQKQGQLLQITSI